MTLPVLRGDPPWPKGGLPTGDDRRAFRDMLLASVTYLIHGKICRREARPAPLSEAVLVTILSPIQPATRRSSACPVAARCARRRESPPTFDAGLFKKIQGGAPILPIMPHHPQPRLWASSHSVSSRNPRFSRDTCPPVARDYDYASVETVVSLGVRSTKPIAISTPKVLRTGGSSGHSLHR